MAHCKECGEKLPFLNTYDGRLCHSCGEKAQAAKKQTLKEQRERQKHEQHELSQRLAGILLTTETAPSLPIADRVGVITAEYVVGMHLFRDIASAFRDVFGGRSETMQHGLKEARESALRELKMQALDLGADAVVAIDLDYSEISGGGKSMLFLVASGTAVKLARSTDA